MGRPLIIVALVTLLMATGVAVASPANQIRLPVTATGESSTTPDTVTVVKGDHLWKISERHLGDHTENAQIVPYWRRVIEINEPGLRSGNPDLIYPGEVITLPEISGQP